MSAQNRSASTRATAVRPAGGSVARSAEPTRIALVALAAVVAIVLVVVAVRLVCGGSSGGSSTGEAETANMGTPTDTIVSPNYVADTSFTISFTGDCTLGNDVNFGYDTRLPQYYDEYGPTYFFQNVKSIFDADDYTVVDMEGTLTTSEERNYEQFAFKADPEYVNILTYGNVQAATLANNHSHDYGDQSYTDTWNTLEQAGIVPFGYDDIAYVTINGAKVALIGMYELDEYLGIKDNMLQNIQKAKDAGSNVIIMFAHWGEEKMYVPDEIQVELGHAAIDAGVDLVVGCHPHRIQGIEEYNGRYIAYSMGNFCFGGNNAPSDMDCYIFQKTFTFKNGELQISDGYNVIPCSISSDDTMNNYQPTPATGDEYTRIMTKIEEYSAQIPQL